MKTKPWSYPTAVTRPLSKAAGSASRAAAWYDAADQGLLKVGLTPAGSKSTNEVQTLLERYGVLAESRLLAVRFSEQDLELRRDAVEELVRPLMAAGRAQVGTPPRSTV